MFTAKVTMMAITVVSINVNIDHFLPPVSFFMVRSVVVHGKCSKENSIKFSPVTKVHPLSTNRFLSTSKLSSSRIAPVDR